MVNIRQKIARRNANKENHKDEETTHRTKSYRKAKEVHGGGEVVTQWRRIEGFQEKGKNGKAVSQTDLPYNTKQVSVVLKEKLHK